MSRLPSTANFAKLSASDQVATIRAAQRHIDNLTVFIRSGLGVPEHRTRGEVLRDIRRRQQRLNKLAASFGYRREWRKHVRVPAGSEHVSAAT